MLSPSQPAVQGLDENWIVSQLRLIQLLLPHLHDPSIQEAVERYRFRSFDGWHQVDLIGALLSLLQSALDAWSGVGTDDNRDAGMLL